MMNKIKTPERPCTADGIDGFRKPAYRGSAHMDSNAHICIIADALTLFKEVFR